MSMLALVSSWFTPTSLFLFVNVMIGTIAVTSRFASHKKQEPENYHQQLVRAPSLLQRVRSIDLYSYKFSPFYSESGTQTATATEIRDPPPQLERVPSLLERVKSIKFPSFHRSDPETEHYAQTDTDPVPDMGHIADSGAEHHVKRSKSESRVVPNKHEQEKMKKSGSEKAVAVEDEKQDEDLEKVERRRPATARIEKTGSFGDEGVDAKADDFINKFRQQLRLQRLDSLLRYGEILRGKQY
uniref:Uncharacterized protein MANES_03G034300 n=1 Tax=Rhizophora mucronata TaxID=61149 RepID=A0A2P2NYD0_RHIMU